MVKEQTNDTNFNLRDVNSIDIILKKYEGYMREEYTFKMLCNKYNISINRNDNILTYEEYIDIDNTLNYLINKLKVSLSSVEKHSNILYTNMEVISKNVDFLKTKIAFSKIETCLYVLRTKPDQLIDTYNYVFSNYGIDAINSSISILSCPVKIIKAVEDLNLNFEKIDNLSIANSVNFGKTKVSEIQKIIQSNEFKDHRDLFTSQTLAHAKLEDIQKLLNMPYWKDKKYCNLLKASVVSQSKVMIRKIPILIEMAERYKIDKYINTTFLLSSPSQNYAKINYLIQVGKPLVIDGKLNPIFTKQPGLLKKKYGIDIKELIKRYPIEEMNIGGMRR